MNLTKTIQEEYTRLSKNEKSEIKQSKNARKLQELYEMWLDDIQTSNKLYYNVDVHYHYARGLFRGAKQNYSLEDISYLSLFIDEQKEKEFYELSGSFLSALINMHYERTKTKETYIIFTTGEVDNGNYNCLEYVGFENEGATIHVIGNVGTDLGVDMTSGSITIEGKMSGEIGSNMQGNIQIKGGLAYLYFHPFLFDAAEHNGTLIVNGTIDHLGANESGKNLKVIHNGKKLNFI